MKTKSAESPWPRPTGQAKPVAGETVFMLTPHRVRSIVSSIGAWSGKDGRRSTTLYRDKHWSYNGVRNYIPHIHVYIYIYTRCTGIYIFSLCNWHCIHTTLRLDIPQPAISLCRRSMHNMHNRCFDETNPSCFSTQSLMDRTPSKLPWCWKSHWHHNCQSLLHSQLLS